MYICILDLTQRFNMKIEPIKTIVFFLKKVLYTFRIIIISILKQFISDLTNDAIRFRLGLLLQISPFHLPTKPVGKMLYIYTEILHSRSEELENKF